MEKAIRERWQEYGRLKDAGEYYSALCRVAEVYSSLPHLPPDLKVQTEKKCQQLRIGSRVIESTKQGIKTDEERIMRICSVGTKWQPEELVLLITLKVQIDLVILYLDARGFALRSKVQEECLRAIKRVGSSKQNRKAFQQAAAGAKRNWGLPVDHELLRG